LSSAPADRRYTAGSSRPRRRADFVAAAIREGFSRQCDEDEVWLAQLAFDLSDANTPKPLRLPEHGLPLHSEGIFVVHCGADRRGYDELS
jgi:hypothetical protein